MIDVSIVVIQVGMTKVLNEKQQKFMAVLFEEANGDVVAAKKLAGYSDTTTTHDVIKCLRDEIAEATRDYMSRIAPKAAVAMGNALVDPTELGIRDKMVAAKDLLDRAGYIKTEKVNVESSGGLFVLPAKEGKNE
jgi:ribosomal protein L3